MWTYRRARMIWTKSLDLTCPTVWMNPFANVAALLLQELVEDQELDEQMAM